MNPEIRELLHLMAEITVATVALTGIIMVLTTTRSLADNQRGAQIAMQLRMSSTVAFFSVFPLIVDTLNLTEPLMWRVSSGVYLSIVGYFLTRTLVFADPTFRSEKGPLRNLTLSAGISAVILLGANLFLARAEPHLIQLFLGWVVSMLLFRAFILEALK